MREIVKNEIRYFYHDGAIKWGKVTKIRGNVAKVTSYNRVYDIPLDGLYKSEADCRRGRIAEVIKTVNSSEELVKFLFWLINDYSLGAIWDNINYQAARNAAQKLNIELLEED